MSESAVENVTESTVQNGELTGNKETVKSFTDEIKDGRNRHLVKCQFCPSHILNPGLGTYYESQYELPMMTKKKAQKEETESNRAEKETLTNFWQVNDMYSFENIGFSNTVGEVKYLACADCEIGPVGYYNMNTKVSYVALDRVYHVN